VLPSAMLFHFDLIVDYSRVLRATGDCAMP
jgi:hypothetical protein